MLPINHLLAQFTAPQLISGNRYTDICDKQILAGDISPAETSAGSDNNCQK